MTINKPEVVTMGDRYPESECYQCGRLKTALSYRARCLTCETQRADANADENDELRTRLSDYEALQDENGKLRAECEELISLLKRSSEWVYPPDEGCKCDTCRDALTLIDDIGAIMGV